MLPDTPQPPNARGTELYKRFECLKSQRAPWDSFWQALANYIQTRKSNINTTTSGPNPENNVFLYDSTATQSNLTLAQGQMTLVSPPDEIWFEFAPPPNLQEDEDARSWYREVTEIIRALLDDSNFYTEMQEMYLQRGGFGTAALYSSIENGGLFFRNYDIGTYSICENHLGEVDTFVREFPLTARQALSQFGDSNLPPEIRQLANDPARCDTEFTFIHFTLPRSDYDSSSSAKLNKPFASIYIDLKTKQIVQEGGFDTFPFHVTRYMRWSDTVTDPYGWCPGWTALPDIRQINLQAQYLDLLGEVAVNPRIKAPAGLEGEIDLRAAGITYFDPVTDQGGPEEWATQGRYDVGLDWYDRRRKRIEEAYHVDLFLLFSKLDKQAQMSVREVAERSSERLLQFSPSFSRLMKEFLNPLLKRVVGLAASLGVLPPPPNSLYVSSDQVVDPNIRYKSRIALAIQSIENTALLEVIEAVGPIAAVDPSVLDPIDFTEAIPGFARNRGVPERWIRSAGEILEIQQQRQALLEAQQEAEANLNNARASREFQSNGSR